MIDKNLLFISPSLVEKEVELADGKKHKLYFKEIAGLEFSRMVGKLDSNDEVERGTAVASIIVSSICNEDGTPALTQNEVFSLKTKVLKNIFDAVMEVSRGSNEGKV